MARAMNQPSFDFLTGAELSPARSRREPLRETVRQSSASTRDQHGQEELHAQLKRIQYELDALKTERELSTIQHEQEIAAIQERAEADFKRAQSAQHGGENLTRKLDALQRESADATSRATNEKLALEKKVRDLQADNRELRGELEDAQAELAEIGRRHQHGNQELSRKYDALHTTVEEMQTDLAGKTAALSSAQQRLMEKERDFSDLETEVIGLRGQGGDSEAIEVLQKELSDQVSYIKKLETTKRTHEQELKSWRTNAKNVEVVEEEKRALETRLRVTESVRQELAESELQRRILEDEKKQWTIHLESQEATDKTYNTPEEMAKGLVEERLERLSLVDQLGRLQPELEIREDNIKALKKEIADLKEQLHASQADTTQGDGKAQARLERQKNLAVKEVEYLRAQMKSFEAEETEFTPGEIDEQHSKRIAELEDLLNKYRSELQSVHAELSKVEIRPIETPRKRARQEDHETEPDRSGELYRQLKIKQQEAQTLQTRTQVLEAELKASASYISSLKESSRTRSLELKHNPTAEFEAIKMSTLRTLRDENGALLAMLEGKQVKAVPISTLESHKQQLEEVKEQLAKTEKKTLRLKQIWSSKALEFREAVASILGWKLDFLPNGSVKATSILYPESDDEENSIVFDGEKGTMKVSGGTQSLFAREIQGHIDFWVDGRKEVPCFLAACTLEFYERTTRAQ